MGVDFRGARYVRRVRFGKRTVKEGEAVAVWDVNGRHKQVVGPRLVRLWYSTIRFLDNHIAQSGQYLRIHNRDGTIEHRRGPTSLFENPVYHTAVTVEEALELLDASSHLLIQNIAPDAASHKGDHATAGSGETAKSQVASGGASYRIVTGPLVYFPEPTERIHAFHWHDKGAGALRSECRILSTTSTMTRTLQVSAQDVSGHTATVKADLKARVVSAEEALRVGDPVAECDAQLKNAIIQALSKVQFAQQDTALMTIIRQAVLAETTTASLKAALKARAGCELLQLDIPAVEPAADLEALRRKEDQLSSAKMQEQLAAMNLEASVKRQEREQELQMKQQEHELRLAARETEAGLKKTDAEVRARVAYLKDLRAMGVDLTKYLCATAATSSKLNL